MPARHLEKVEAHARKALAPEPDQVQADLIKRYRSFLKKEEHRIRLQHKGRFDEFIQQKVQPMYASPHSARATSKRRVWDCRRRSSKSCAAAAT